jgi:glutathione peroxidase-family protein
MANLITRALGAVQDTTTRVLYGAEKATNKPSFYACVDRALGTNVEVPMSDFQGNVVVVVNVASKWGKTKENYQQLPKLVDEFPGLKVLAFPCNQFGGQEPGSADEIMEFVKKYDQNMLKKLSFFEKKDVNGAGAREVFSFLKQALPAEDGTTDVRWNFSTYQKSTYTDESDSFSHAFCLSSQILNRSPGKSSPPIWNHDTTVWYASKHCGAYGKEGEWFFIVKPHYCSLMPGFIWSLGMTVSVLWAAAWTQPLTQSLGTWQVW